MYARDKADETMADRLADRMAVHEMRRRVGGPEGEIRAQQTPAFLDAVQAGQSESALVHYVYLDVLRAEAPAVHEAEVTKAAQEAAEKAQAVQKAQELF